MYDINYIESNSKFVFNVHCFDECRKLYTIIKIKKLCIEPGAFILIYQKALARRGIDYNQSLTKKIEEW
ncbi:hypothetical protein BCY86_06405 [Pajaroellobacter abortibovis]|uniref:Uncharacterized protein n=1 Tax=Pajaroellobacter abortibovis TaxID=1882918 RepID=A0A1L6MXX6_9BACT|nr:hypothetical protein BCY86_06405 [Pajaroellobacter abortibovis]